MGQVLHGSATTTEAVRRAIQAGQEGVRTLARRHGISPTTVQEWRERPHTADAAMGPEQPRSTVPSPEDEAAVVAFRRRAPLPPGDCLYALQPSLPHLTRSSLHRCLQRHGTARLPDTDGDKPKRPRSGAYPIGFFHIGIAEVRTEERRLRLFVAVDRTSKFAFAQPHERATRRTAADFLRALVAAVPCRIRTVRTDDGTQFVDRTPINEEAEARADACWAVREEPRIRLVHAFDHACGQNGIGHRTTKPALPWTNGRAERMSRTLKDAAVRRRHYGSHDELRRHPQPFLDAYNHARRLKTLRGLTPCEFSCETWTGQPSRFTSNPTHYTPGPNS